MTIVLRPAEPADAAGIRAVHRQAFPTDAEAGLVAALEVDGDVLLSLVADRGGTIAGHVLFSRMDAAADGRVVRAAALAPVAVLPAHQGAGIGSGLIEQGLGLLAEDGIRYVFVLGDVGYYAQFDFDPAIGAIFASPYAGEHWMGLVLDDSRLPQAGAARHAPAFGRMGE